jgi:hypothetical protein
MNTCPYSPTGVSDDTYNNWHKGPSCIKKGAKKRQTRDGQFIYTTLLETCFEKGMKFESKEV